MKGMLKEIWLDKNYFEKAKNRISIAYDRNKSNLSLKDYDIDKFIK